MRLHSRRAESEQAHDNTAFDDTIANSGQPSSVQANRLWPDAGGSTVHMLSWKLAPFSEDFPRVDTPYPNHLMIELTDRCNLKCMICVREEYEQAIGGPGYFMELDEVQRLETPIRHANVITVTGFGETFLHPRLQGILSYIYSINPSDNLISIVTNGTALDAEKASWFSGHLHTISVSLNASHAEAYAREMHPYEYAAGKDVSTRFDRLVRRITAFADALNEEERRKVHLHYVVHRDNVEDLADFVTLAHGMGLSTVCFTHLMVHRAEHVERSIYWIRDQYNDSVDEAVEIGQRLGVTVVARKFFTEQQREFVAERDCTWPNDTAIVGARGKMVPCCYWGVTEVGNIFGSETFDSIWFGDYYAKLREQRIGPACATCNILRVFDDVTMHFSPFLKSQPAFKERLESYQKMSAMDTGHYADRFNRAGLDMALHRWALRKVTGDFSSLLDVVDGNSNLLAPVELRLWEDFRKRNAAIEGPLTVDLSGRFIGLGWGPAGRNAHGQTWRWLGGHDGPASVFMHLRPGWSYTAEFELYTAASPDVLDSICVTANGAEVALERLYWHKDRYYYSCIVTPAAEPAEGHVWLSISAGKPATRVLGAQELALTSLTVRETDTVITGTVTEANTDAEADTEWADTVSKSDEIHAVSLPALDLPHATLLNLRVAARSVARAVSTFVGR